MTPLYNNIPPVMRRGLLGLLVGLLPLACTEAAPERLLTGNLTDLQGRPLSGAAVALNGKVTLTASDGSFQLLGVEPEPGDLLTAAAQGFTAWSLPLDDALTRFTARLQPRPAISALTVRTLEVTLQLPRPAEVDRTVYLSLGNGQVFPVYLFVGNDAATLTVPLYGGNTLSAISPPPGPFERALTAAPITLEDSDTQRTLQLLDLTPPPLQIDLRNLPDRADASLDIVLACSRQGDAFLAARDTLTAPLPTTLTLPLLLDTTGATCDLAATLDLPTPDGAARHVAFAFNLPGDTLRDNTPTLTLPTLLALRPRTQGPDLTWAAHPQATLYDLYIAPDEGDRVGAPIWSATTDQTALALPDLPAAARERLGLQPNQRYLLRVIARLAPRFDLHGDWDWTGYNAYIASPWTPLPEAALTRWR